MTGRAERWTAGVVAATVAAGGLVAAVAPLAVVLGANRLAVFALLATGAWATIGRLGVVDLGTGAAAGLGAYAGGVSAATQAWPLVVGLPLGAVAGAAVGAVSGALAGRVGRVLSALTSLTVGAAAVAGLAIWPGGGGRAGFHAVPLLTGSDRGDLVVLLGLVALGVVVVARFAGSTAAARGHVAAVAPHVAAALGRRPVLDAAAGAAIGGGLLGLAGAVGAAATGSVAPGAYGLSLAAGLALAVLVGGGRPVSGVVGALVVWGPGILWPTVPYVGDAPLLVVGVLGIALLAWRPAGLLPPRARPSPRLPEPAPPAPRGGPRELLLDALPLVRGATVTVQVAPGEVVALAGPNGVGKSTALARIAGQVDDGGAVRLRHPGEHGPGDRPGSGATARARLGIARTWQRPPTASADDVLRSAASDPAGAAAAAWARDLLGTDASTPGGAQLVWVAAQRPAIALLDEPAAELDPAVVERFGRGLADQGVAVVLVEHRLEALAGADRVVWLTDGRAP